MFEYAYKKLLLSLTLPIIFSWASAQEICNNGIDDDNDGLIDCYDPDCKDNNQCNQFYYSIDSDTSCIKPNNTTYPLEVLWSCVVDEKNLTGVPYRVTITGDIDQDGVPEVIFPVYDSIVIINGSTGNIENKFAIGSSFGQNINQLAIGDVDDDRFGEVLFGAGLFAYCYEHDGTLKWRSDTLPGGLGIPCNLANFNDDDTVEIYGGRNILNARTGRIINSSKHFGFTSIFSASVAVDVLDSSATCPECDGLELVYGNTVYGIDIDNNAINVRSTAPIGRDTGSTSIADINNDGLLDIVVNQAIVPATSNDKMYCWDPRTGNLIGNVYVSPGGVTYSHPVLANFDTDPEIEIVLSATVSSGPPASYQMVLLDYDPIQDSFLIAWEKPIIENSPYCSPSAFDFDCDGICEVVYRGSDSLKILNASNGDILSSIYCPNGTLMANPVIADVNGDAHANIISVKEKGDTAIVMAFKSTLNNWPPTRTVWNQYNYFNVNINDDLSIPTQQQMHANPSLVNQDAFIQQSSLYDQNGMVKCYSSIADATVNIISLNDTGNCNDLQIDLEICNNTENVNISPSFSLSFYLGSKSKNGVNILDTIINQSIISDTCIIIPRILLKVVDTDSLFVYINESLNSIYAQFDECDTFNNSNSIAIDKINISSSHINVICPNDTVSLTDIVGTFQVVNIQFVGTDTSLSAIVPNQEGSYLVSYEDSNQCIVTDTLHVELDAGCSYYFIPNVFSPNGDGLNDDFGIIGTNIEYAYLNIYDYWGNLLFTSNEKDAKWQGYFKSEPVIEDIYVYEGVVKLLGKDSEDHIRGNFALVK